MPVHFYPLFSPHIRSQVYSNKYLLNKKRGKFPSFWQYMRPLAAQGISAVTPQIRDLPYPKTIQPPLILPLYLHLPHCLQSYLLRGFSWCPYMSDDCGDVRSPVYPYPFSAVGFVVLLSSSFFTA